MKVTIRDKTLPLTFECLFDISSPSTTSLTKKMESVLGPDTGDLGIRIGVCDGVGFELVVCIYRIFVSRNNLFCNLCMLSQGCTVVLSLPECFAENAPVFSCKCAHAFTWNPFILPDFTHPNIGLETQLTRQQ